MRTVPPGFAPDLDGSEVASLTVLTANYPAEYGRKLGGVIEVVTGRDLHPGLHGSAEIGGGSFDTETTSFAATYGWKLSAFNVSATANHTDRYLDPPVQEDFTNRATADGVAAGYEWELSDSDRLHFSVHRRQTLFLVPNEILQETAGQRQDRNGREDLGQAAWTHEFSPRVVLNALASVEDLSANLWSNARSTLVIAFQERGFRRAYLRGVVSGQRSPRVEVRRRRLLRSRQRSAELSHHGPELLR